MLDMLWHFLHASDLVCSEVPGTAAGDAAPSALLSAGPLPHTETGRWGAIANGLFGPARGTSNMLFAWAHGTLPCAAGHAGERRSSQRRPDRSARVLLTVAGHRPWGKRVREGQGPVSSASQASRGGGPRAEGHSRGGGVWCERGGAGRPLPAVLLDPRLRRDCPECLGPPHGRGPREKAAGPCAVFSGSQRPPDAPAGRCPSQRLRLPNQEIKG